MMLRNARLTGFAAAFTLSLAAQSPASAQDNFYAGKVVRFVVSGGGAYEAYARLFAQYLPNYIPGKPAMIVQEMPGGGGIRAASFLNTVAPKDGTVLGALHGSVITAPLLQPGVADFDVTKFNWLGNASRDAYIGYVTKSSPVQSLEEAKTRELIVGGTSLGSNGIDMAIIGRDLFGLKFKIIPGYKTSDETKLAMERGEINGTVGSTWGSLKATDWVQRGAVKVILQHGAKPHPELLNVPLFGDYAKTDLDRQILDVMRVRGEFTRPYVAPPGVPKERVEMLRTAFMQVVRDPGFLADVARRGLEFDSPTSGADLTVEIERVSRTPPETIARLLQVLGSFNDGK